MEEKKIKLNPGTFSNEMNNKAKEILNCKNCAFALPKKGTMIGQFIAECRRFPPQILLIQNAPVISWPIVSDNPSMFCYEFSDIPLEEEKENG